MTFIKAGTTRKRATYIFSNSTTCMLLMLIEPAVIAMTRCKYHFHIFQIKFSKLAKVIGAVAA